MTIISPPASDSMAPRPRGTAIPLHGVGAICMFLYLVLALRSRAPGEIDVFEYLVLHGILVVLVLGYWYTLFLQGRDIRFGPVLFWAVLFRLAGVFGQPMLEDDYFRYLLDGCVFVSQGSPYGVAPAELFQGNALPASCQLLLNRVNNPELPTIYGPPLQLLFAVSHLFSAADISGLQLMFSVADLGLVALLARLAPARNVLLYAWCPLVLKEISFTAHPDIVAILLLMLALVCRERGASALAVVLIATAVAARIFALPLVPFVLIRLSPGYWLLFTLVLLAWHLPFIVQGSSDLEVLGVFSMQWTHNASVFALLAASMGDQVARLVCAGLFISGWSALYCRYRRSYSRFTIPPGEWIIGLLLLLSPVVNPWYVLWLLPFAVLRPAAWCWTLASVVVLAYVTGVNYPASDLGAYQIAPWAWYLQILLVLAAIVLDLWKPGQRRSGARWRPLPQGPGRPQQNFPGCKH